VNRFHFPHLYAKMLREERLRTSVAVIQGHPWVPTGAAQDVYARAAADRPIYEAFEAGFSGQAYSTPRVALLKAWTLGRAMRNENVPTLHALEAFERCRATGLLLQEWWEE